MFINGNTYTIGADPELFMGYDDRFVSAHDAIWGDKMKPQPVKNGAVQVDGMALEFNIDPVLTREEFIHNINSVKNTLASMIGENTFLEDVSVMFDEAFLEGVPDFNKVLGCSADYNGWTREENPSPDGDTLMRTAGGHVHIGDEVYREQEFEMDHYLECARLSRIMDETVGVYSVLWDKDDKRRNMYGAAGAFRPKKYGMEYRTLSNAWIFDDELMSFVYDGTEKALTLFQDKEYEPDPICQHIINTSDRGNSFFKNNQTVKLMGL